MSTAAAFVQDSTGMRTWLTSMVLAALLGCVVVAVAVGTAGPVAAQEIDTEFPPGNPVLGDDRPVDVAGRGDTNFGLWVVAAACLIGAGTLLIKIERWEVRRIEHHPPKTKL